MSTEQQLQVDAAALRREILDAARAYIEAARAPQAGEQAIAIRTAALISEKERRERSGVRVNMNADSFDARHAALATDAMNAASAQARDKGKHAQALAVLALRADTLLAEFGQALDAREQAEAARVAQVEAEAAASASRSWQGGYLGRR